jgi:peptidoglycan hydrolase-like protein with peptidoglycan-binding domain
MSDATVVPPAGQNFLALPVGTVIGRYRVTGILGQGSFGITYRAHDDQLGRDVAIKEYLPSTFAVRHGGRSVLPNSTGAIEDFAWGRQRFIEEGRTLAGFQRAPGIVRVHDFLEANGTAYIVMELVRGETLGVRLQRQERLAAPEVERILRALLDGLERVHAAGFIHRDIKPANILLDDEGHPTLIDFGAARAAVAGRTSALTGIFTPGYAAVEQFTDARQGPFTDIYGLAATLYQSITGEKPPSAIDRVLDDKYVPLAKRKPAGFALPLLAGIDRGMASRPEARPQTIAAWRALLFPGETPAKPDPARVPEKPTRWRVASIAGLAAVLAAAGAGGALLLFSLQEEAPVTDADRQQAERSAAAAEKQRAEDEVQRRVAAAAAEKRQADEEAQRQAAAEAAAAEKRRVDEEAQRRAAAAAASAEKRRADEDAQRQAAAEDAQRSADQDARAAAAAEQARREAADAEQRQAARRADQEAREQEARAKATAEETARKVEADAAKARAEAALGRKTAEAAEAALQLGPVDRQRLQLALTAQGFDTRGTDGVLGPRSREMVAAWQAARNYPVTGFIDAAQRQRLLGDSAAALAKFDSEQKKAAEEEARRREQPKPDATTAAVAPPRPAPDAAPSVFAGRWSIVRSKCIPTTPQRFFGVTVEGNRFTYGFAFANRTASCTVSIGPDGSFANNSCEAPISGRISGNRMTVSQRHPETICDFEFQKQ